MTQKSLDKKKTKELDWEKEFETLLLDIALKQKPFVKNYPLGQLKKLYSWHQQKMKELLERVEKEVIGEYAERIYCITIPDPITELKIQDMINKNNDRIDYQRQKLKDLEKEYETQP